MIQRDELPEMIALYALGAVAEDERRAVEDAASADPRVRAELDGYLLTAAELAAGLLDGTEEPSEAVWERIAASIGAPTPVPGRGTPVPWPSRVLSAVAAGAVVLAVVLGVQVLRQRSEIDELHADPLAAAIEQARDTGASRIALSGDVEAEIVLSSDGVGYFVGPDLPPLGADQTYQLWAIVDDRVISAGVFGPTPEVAPFRVNGDVGGFALTVEVAGGVVSSEEEPVALGLLEG